MSTSITASFVTSYEARVKHIWQREGSYLKDSVRMRPGVVGSTAVFNLIGKGTATTKSRHGTITPMNQDHTAPSCVLQDLYAGDWVDKLDESKITIDERDAIARGGAMALGRGCDDQITTVLSTTTQPAVTLTVTSKATVLATAIELTEALWANDVPNNNENYALVTPRYWSQLMTLDQFQNADYVSMEGQAFRNGPDIGRANWKMWQGIFWKMQTGLPGAGTGTAEVYAYNKQSVGYASAQLDSNVADSGDVAADITWHGDRAAHFVNHWLSGQACMIDDTGVIKGDVDDIAPIVTT